MTAFGVHSEAGKLRTVLVCRPGLAQRRLTPGNRSSFLFDDVLWVDRAIADHAVFVQAMQSRGIEVLELQHLLGEVCLNSDARDWMLDRVVNEEEIGIGMLRESRLWLEELPAHRLAEALTGGVAKSELPFDARGLLGGAAAAGAIGGGDLSLSPALCRRSQGMVGRCRYAAGPSNLGRRRYHADWEGGRTDRNERALQCAGNYPAGARVV